MYKITSYWNLVRPGIVALVLAVMGVAAWTAAETPPAGRTLLHALVGAGCVIVGAIALNQRLERHGDTRMARTAGRPLPAGTLHPGQVTGFGVVATLLGFAYLAFFSNMLLLILAAFSWLLYVAAYTPLKSRSLWQVPLGAVAGAMPALLGAAAAGEPGSPMAWSLFGIVFWWQFPHAMAIAWLYREDFAAAGMKVASVADPSGRTAGRLAVAGAFLLIPTCCLPVFWGLADFRYLIAAGGLSTVYAAAATHFLWSRTDLTARRLLWASLVWLPLMLAALIVCRK